MSRYVMVPLLIIMLVSIDWAEQQHITVDVDLVNIYFTVCNRKGRPIGNLDRDSFTVLEDGRPQVVTNFSREMADPLTVALLIDTSGSVRHKLSIEQETIIEFLYAALRRGRDKAAILTFDSNVELKQDYTDDPALLAAAVRKIRAGGGTRLYDALYFVLTEKLNGTGDRKVIVVITDGDDKSSQHSAVEVTELAQRNNVIIYAISINALGGPPPNPSAVPDEILGTIAVETGGICLFPTKLKGLIADFMRINDDLHFQYTLAYRSTNPNRDGAFRRVQINPKDSRYHVRTRSGYYAPQSVAVGRR